MDQVITFDKSLQIRLNEYHGVFSALNLPYSKIESEWAFYLELTLDPNGWQAVWKIPRLKCEELEIAFPTIVLIYVLNVSFSDLMALVRILAVQDDIHLPEKQYVPLTQLWPTKQQDKSIGLNLNTTANVLDMLRVFYTHILMPWDEDEDSPDWKEAHLLSRLRFYYDLKNGKIPKATSEHICTLLNEARRLNSKRKQLVNLCDGSDSEPEDNNTEALIEINVRLIEIQNQVHLLENEMFRKVILKRQEISEPKSTIQDPVIWVIPAGGTAGSHMQLLKSIEELYPNEYLFFNSNLMSKLDSANANDTILLSPSKHTIKTEGALIDNITLKGIGDRAKIISLADDIMIDCVGAFSIFENITFNCKKSQCAILVRKGHVTIKNCILIGDDSSTTHQGILVLNGAKLSLIGCDVSGFSMAITGNSGSTIDIKDSAIHTAYSGVTVYDNCQMGLYRSVIRDCKGFGIVVETEKDFSAVGTSFGSLDVVPHVITESLQGTNNQKGDVIIRKFNIKGVENLFEDLDLDPTIIEMSDDEMETNLDNSVVESL